MSIVDQRGLDVLYTHIHRLTAQRTTLSSRTPEQIAHVLRNFGYQRFRRAETALCLYWQLAEGRLEEWPCQPFLTQVTRRIRQDEEQEATGGKQSPSPASVIFEGMGLERACARQLILAAPRRWNHSALQAVCAVSQEGGIHGKSLFSLEKGRKPVWMRLRSMWICLQWLRRRP